MKSILKIIISMMLIVLTGCSATSNKINDISQAPETTENNTPDTIENNAPNTLITKELAYEGVLNYCKNNYDWSIAEENPSIMYVSMGDESENEYQVIFRSYTGTLMYFYVDKLNGETKIIESVPTLDIENEIGTINLYDYINEYD